MDEKMYTVYEYFGMTKVINCYYVGYISGT